MTSLSEIRDELLQRLGPTQFSLLNTRVTLATGVNLRTPKPEDDRNWTVVAQVRRALTDMGVKA